MKNATTYTLLFVLISFTNLSLAQELLPPQIKRDLTQALSQELHMYPLNSSQNTQVFTNIDNWVSTQFQLRRAERTIVDGDTSFVLIEKMRADRYDPGIIASFPEGYQMLYTKGGQTRIYYNELKIPLEKRLTKEEVNKNAMAFVNTNKFIFQSQIDKIEGIHAFNRIRQRDDTVNTIKYTLLQRAIFQRSVDGRKVLNSKFIVDYSPDGKRILAVKSLNWTPLTEEKKAVRRRKTNDQLYTEIEATLRGISYPMKVSDAELMYYQTAGYLIPVLRIKVRPVDPGPTVPIVQNYVFPVLEEDLGFGEDLKEDDALPVRKAKT